MSKGRKKATYSSAVPMDTRRISQNPINLSYNITVGVGARLNTNE